MSNASKITLEARVKLPPKVQDVVCDASLIASHAVAAANSSEMLNSCLKVTSYLDQTNDVFSKVLNMMNDDADVLNQQVKEAFERCLSNNAALVFLGKVASHEVISLVVLDNT